MTIGTQRAAIEGAFARADLPTDVVAEVLDSYLELKRRYALGDHRPGVLEAGRFAEGVFRICQHSVLGSFTPIGKTLPPVDQLAKQLESAAGKDGLRLHIPRILRSIYDLRNKRDIAHLADGIDPNLQDSTLVIASCDWVMAELVRTFAATSIADAASIVESIVVKTVPSLEWIDGFPKLLKSFRTSEHVSVVLYSAPGMAMSIVELSKMIPASMRANLRRTLRSLDEKNWVHFDEAAGKATLTRLGQVGIEAELTDAPI